MIGGGVNVKRQKSKVKRIRIHWGERGKQQIEGQQKTSVFLVGNISALTGAADCNKTRCEYLR